MTRKRALAALDAYLAVAAPFPRIGEGRRPRSRVELDRERTALRELAVALNERQS